jgi:hypothetical protein
MDCYRILGGDSDTPGTDTKLAESYARDVVRLGTDATGAELSPIRNAEAHITLGVIAARQGDLETTIDYGQRALAGERLSASTGQPPPRSSTGAELRPVIQTRSRSDGPSLQLAGHAALAGLTRSMRTRPERALEGA